MVWYKCNEAIQCKMYKRSWNELWIAKWSKYETYDRINDGTLITWTDKVCCIYGLQRDMISVWRVIILHDASSSGQCGNAW